MPVLERSGVLYLVCNFMARKRMFDKDIIETDSFLSISMSAKAIYFLLGMEADDEGFVSPTRILRLYGGERGDLKNLIDVGLIIPFQSGVVVITHWNQNNWLDNRRIKPTQYQNEKKLLSLSSENKYMLSNGLATAEPEESRVVESRGEENRTDITASPFVWIDYLKELEENKREDLQLIGYFFKRKNLSFSSKAQAQIAIKRHLRAAKDLVSFEKNKVFRAMDECDISEKKRGIIWTLDTCIKLLTK